MYALEQAAPRLTDAHLARLELANDNLRAALARHDAVGAVSADNNFHEVWVEQTRNHELTLTLG